MKQMSSPKHVRIYIGIAKDYQQYEMHANAQVQKQQASKPISLALGHPPYYVHLKITRTIMLDMATK